MSESFDEVINILCSCRNFTQLPIPLGIRSANESSIKPRNDKENSAIFRVQKQHCSIQANITQDNVNALGRFNKIGAGLARKFSDLVGPRPGGIQHYFRFAFKLLASQAITHLNSRKSSWKKIQRSYFKMIGNCCPTLTGCLDNFDAKSGVIHLGIKVLQAKRWEFRPWDVFFSQVKRGDGFAMGDVGKPS